MIWLLTPYLVVTFGVFCFARAARWTMWDALAAAALWPLFVALCLIFMLFY